MYTQHKWRDCFIILKGIIDLQSVDNDQQHYFAAEEAVIVRGKGSTKGQRVIKRKQEKW